MNILFKKKTNKLRIRIYVSVYIKYNENMNEIKVWNKLCGALFIEWMKGENIKEEKIIKSFNNNKR